MASKVYQILGVFLQRLVVVVGTLRLHLLALAQLVDGGAQVLLGDASIFQDASSRLAVGEQGQQQRLYADEFVTHLLGIVLSLQQYTIGGCTQIGFAASNARQMFQFGLYQQVYLLCVSTHLLQQEVHDVLGFIEYARQQMNGFDGLLTISLCGVDGLLYRLLCFDGKLV